MANTEALDRSAYGATLPATRRGQNFLANQSEQARNENDNYWNNLWNTVKNIGSAALTAYDGYKGYTQQQWENDFAREQWEYNKNRTDQSDALNAYQQAFNLYTQGAGDAASDVLNRYGLNANAFANYNGAPVTRDDQAGVLSTAASLVASGNQEAAANLLKMYGLDSNAPVPMAPLQNVSWRPSWQRRQLRRAAEVREDPAAPARAEVGGQTVNC